MHLPIEFNNTLIKLLLYILSNICHIIVTSHWHKNECMNVSCLAVVNCFWLFYAISGHFVPFLTLFMKFLAHFLFCTCFLPFIPFCTNLIPFQEQFAHILYHFAPNCTHFVPNLCHFVNVLFHTVFHCLTLFYDPFWLLYAISWLFGTVLSQVYQVLTILWLCAPFPRQFQYITPHLSPLQQHTNKKKRFDIYQ